jgi:predicted RNA-binding protein (virulence factor B family)
MNPKHLKNTVGPGVFAPFQKVDVEIHAFTDLGIKVAINDEYAGLVYRNQVFDEYREGQKLQAYIQCVREDGRIDVSLQPNQCVHVYSTTERILEHLKAAGGKSRFNNQSSPEDIKVEFQVSKKVFKQAVSSLYKKRLIEITDEGIELVE